MGLLTGLRPLSIALDIALSNVCAGVFSSNLVGEVSEDLQKGDCFKGHQADRRKSTVGLSEMQATNCKTVPGWLCGIDLRALQQCAPPGIVDRVMS